MAKDNHELPQSVSKRDFLQAAAAFGGVSAVLTALDGWGMGFASAADAACAPLGET